MTNAKSPGSIVTLRVAYGPVPRAGVVLQTPSGRRYWVFSQTGKTLRCSVMAPSDPIPKGAPVIPWFWAGRKPQRDDDGRPLAQLIWEHCQSAQSTPDVKLGQEGVSGFGLTQLPD